MTPGEMAGRIEAAEGPSRALAREVQCAFGGWHRVTPGQGGGKHGAYIAPEDWNGRDSGGRPILDSLHGTDMVRDVPDLTASLDAAVAFVERVLPGSNWCLTKDKEADVEWGGRREERWFHSPVDNGDKPRSYAKTPAMALVAAALRALQDAPDGAK